jgi:hypothetical protein
MYLLSTLHFRMEPTSAKVRIQHGKYSKEELQALDCAVKEYAQKHGLSTTNFE